MNIKVNTSSPMKVTDNFLYDTLCEGMRLYTLSLDMVTNIMKLLETPEKYTDSRGYVLLDDLENFDRTIDGNNNIALFASNYCSGYSDLKRRVGDALLNTEKAHNLIDVAVQSYIPLSLEELSVLCRVLQELVGHLGLFLNRQFELERVTEQDTNSVISSYLRNNGMRYADLNNLGSNMEELSNQFKPKIDIFDKLPELELQFYDMLSRPLYDTTEITEDMVRGIISGDLTEEQLYVLLGYDDEQLLSKMGSDE